MRKAVGIDSAASAREALRATTATDALDHDHDADLSKARKEKQRETPANVKEVPMPAIFSPCQMISDASISRCSGFAWFPSKNIDA